MRCVVLRRLLWRVTLGALALALPAGAGAHPMGNFSISHYAAIQIEPDAVRLRYLVDLAEIPTFQALQESGLSTDPQHPRTRAYLARTVDALRDALVLEMDGRRLTLQTESSELTFPPGAGGLPTLRIGVPTWFPEFWRCGGHDLPSDVSSDPSKVVDRTHDRAGTDRDRAQVRRRGTPAHTVPTGG